MSGKLGLFQKAGKSGAGGVYYTKRGIPADVRHRMVSDRWRGKTHFVASTGEYGLGQAKLKAAELWAGWAKEVDEVRSLGTAPVATLPNVLASINRWRSKRCHLAAGGIASVFYKATEEIEAFGYPGTQQDDTGDAIYMSRVGVDPLGSLDPTYFDRHPDASRGLEMPLSTAMLLNKLQLASRDPDAWVAIPGFEAKFDESVAIGGLTAAIPMSVRAQARSAFVEAYLEVTQHEEAERRRAAWFLTTLSTPASIKVDSAVPQPAVREGDKTVGEVIDAYTAQRPGDDTDKQFGHIFRALKECLGKDTPIRSVTPGDILDVKNLLRTVPVHATKLYGAVTLTEAAERAAADNKAVLSWNTVRSYVVNLSAVFNYAKDRLKCIDHNPVAGLIGPRRPSVKRRAFTPEELTRVFDSLEPERQTDSAHFWVPALAVWTGARANELCQLNVEDVKMAGDLPYLDLTVFDADGRRTTEKKVKNLGSDRAVPIHPDLVRAGFMSFVQRRRDSGQTRLFPELKPNSLGYHSHEVSRMFGRKLDSLDLTAAALCLHSARHGFRDGARQAQLPTEVADALGGWSVGTAVGVGYGDSRSASVVRDNAAHMARITLGGFRLRPAVGDDAGATGAPSNDTHDASELTSASV